MDAHPIPSLRAPSTHARVQGPGPFWGLCQVTAQSLSWDVWGDAPVPPIPTSCIQRKSGQTLQGSRGHEKMLWVGWGWRRLSGSLPSTRSSFSHSRAPAPTKSPSSKSKGREKDGALLAPFSSGGMSSGVARGQRSAAGSGSLPRARLGWRSTLTILLGLDVEHTAAHAVPGLRVGQHLHAVVGELLHASQLHPLPRGGDILHLAPLCRTQAASECRPGWPRLGPLATAPLPAWAPDRPAPLGSDLDSVVVATRGALYLEVHGGRSGALLPGHISPQLAHPSACQPGLSNPLHPPRTEFNLILSG